MSSAFTWHANYHPTVNNKGGVSKNVILRYWSKLFIKKKKTMSHWFVENVNFIFYANDYFIVKPSHLTCKMLFYYKEYFSIAVKIQIFGLKAWNTNICKYHISIQRMLSAATCNAKHYFTIYNEEWLSKMYIFFENSIYIFRTPFFRK